MRIHSPAEEEPDLCRGGSRPLRGALRGSRRHARGLPTSRLRSRPLLGVQRREDQMADSRLHGGG